jgi:hypothetical protein
MATLPQLLRTREERERAVRIAREIQSWRPTMLPEIEAVLEEVERVLKLTGHEAPSESEAAE